MAVRFEVHEGSFYIYLFKLVHNSLLYLRCTVELHEFE